MRNYIVEKPLLKGKRPTILYRRKYWWLPKLDLAESAKSERKFEKFARDTNKGET